MKLTSAVMAALVAASVAATLHAQVARLHAQVAAPPAQVKERPLPRLVKKDGRYALFVDGAPYLMLGAPTHNSSAWPALPPPLWRCTGPLPANTIAVQAC